jgi:U3 small nucleolar RNA-associated protein 20
MTLLTEAIKGVQEGIHSSGTAIVESMLKKGESISVEGQDVQLDIVTGIMTSVIHHTNAETFAPILRLLLSRLELTLTSGQPYLVTSYSQLLFTIVSVRKGTRVGNWTSVLSVLRRLVDLGKPQSSLESKTRSSILSTLALTFQYAPIDAILPALTLLQDTRKDAWAPYFLQFSDLFARLGRESFQSFLLPEFQKFVLEQWNQHGDDIAQLLPRLPMNQQQIPVPHDFQEQIVQQLRFDPVDDVRELDSNHLHSRNSCLAALPFLKMNPETDTRTQAELLRHVTRALEDRESNPAEFVDFALGACLNRLLEGTFGLDQMRPLWPQFCTRTAQIVALARFWPNLLQYLRLYPPGQDEMEGPHLEILLDSLLKCLSLPSHEIRQAALGILQYIYKLRRVAEPEALSIAALIESHPISLETSRSISMNIRRLAQGYSSLRDDRLMQKAIPQYCFGLLHLQLAPAWDDAIKVLAEMSTNSVAEETITMIAQKWLEGGSCEVNDGHDDQMSVILDVESTGFNVVSDFECSNLAKVAAICGQVFDTPNQGYPSPSQRFSHDHLKTPSTAANAKQQALKVLNKIPNIAEKKSRMLVPVLLSWASASSVDSDGEPWSHGWSRKDQKAMLAVFAQFHNPKVLYRSAEVYGALLNLCANGDVEIQQSALKAISAWKDPAINGCQERLTNLLDEARFRDELAVFLQDTDEEDALVNIQRQSTLLPVLLRLLYGRVVAGGKEGQRTRRRTVFGFLSRYGQDGLGMFVDVALTSANIPNVNAKVSAGQAVAMLKSPSRQQFGMLNMLDDMLETLSSKLEPFAHKLLNAVLVCTISAYRRLYSDNNDGTLTDGSLVRAVRQVGMQCLAKIYSSMKATDFSNQTSIVAAELITPRLDKFSIENTQSVSGTLRLLSAWAAALQTANFMAAQLGPVIQSVAELLRQEIAKDEVRLFVLRDIVDNLLQDGVLLADVHITALVRSIGAVIDFQPSRDVLDACVVSFTKLVEQIGNQDEAQAVIGVCTSLLTRPSKIVSPSAKAGLLETLSLLLEKFESTADSTLYTALCGLFSRMQNDRSRSLLATVFGKLCVSSSELSDIAQICGDLNAVGTRLDEPDLERRERGFVKIYEYHDTFSLQQWQPIVHNSLFYIRDAEDMVNRSNAARVLERFVDAAGRHPEGLSSLLTSIVLPGIERGTVEPSELVRAEYARLLGKVVETLPELSTISDMQTLTVGGDDEASFFANILHIQQHRRLRALRRLAEEAGKIGSNNVTRYLMPLLEHFVFNPMEGDSGRTLADQTVSTLGALAKALKWSSFRATFKRYTGLLKTQPDHEKVLLRLLGVLVDALRGRLREDVSDTKYTNADRVEVITRNFLPPLVGYLHLKDESTVDRRMPVAVTIVKLLQLLPEQEMSLRLAPVLTDVCHVLRSRSPEARDQTRKALAAILELVGPSYFGFLLKELRGALQRGYQLHVLSFTVHSLLVHGVDKYNPGDLDHCLGSIASVVMDDIFGVTGQEKEAEEYKSGMKEVKSSKSYDTMELLARITPVQKLGQLIQPLRALMMEKLDSKMAEKIDGLLNRIRRGLDQNPASESREMLMFCHEIVRHVYAEPQSNRSRKELDAKRSRYIVRPEPSGKTKSKTATTAQTFKLVSFALNLLRKVLRRHEDLQTPANLAGFLPMAGDALVQPQEEVQLSATRLLSTIMSVPLAELDVNAPVYVNEAVRLIKAAPSMTSDSSKAALELVTAVLREKRAVKIKDKDIGDILKSIKTDIDEPDRQGVIYKFLRAILGRKIMITEVYEIMDEIAKVVVTNADRNVREGARSAYIQFIMDYPQGKDRWNKQAAFFVENLKYEHPAGRQSTMELLHQLLSKVSDEVFAQLALTLFVALVPVQVSDHDSDCRQMAGLLIAKLFERANADQQHTFVTLLEKWNQMQASPAIQSAALQCWQILLRTKVPQSKQLERLRDDIGRSLEALENDDSEASNPAIQDALEAFEVLLGTAPMVAFAKESGSIWDSLQSCLRSSTSASKTVAARLLEHYFSDMARTSSRTTSGLSTVPLVGSQGLRLDAGDMRQLCYANLSTLRSASRVSEESLIAKTVRNLAFLGRCFATNGVVWRAEEASASDDEDTEENRDPSALAYLFNRLSYIIRQESFATVSRIAAAECQILLVNQVSSIPDLQGVVRPAYALTDATIPRQASEEQNKLLEKATELLEVLQRRVGMETYLSALGSVRSEAKVRREERRQKRKIEAVSAPERWAKAKKRKHDMRKSVLKARGLESRGKRRGW